MFKGVALAEQGQGEAGLSLLQQGWAALQAIGTRIYSSTYLLMMAHPYGRLGRLGEGLDIIAEAEAFIAETGECWEEAELYRLKGELTLQKFQVQSSEFKVPNTQPLTPSTQAEAEAEACFLQAIAIAQKQQAKSWELRASTSLARLWQQQGKRAEAHKLLSEVYNWFTEGFDTKDLQEAKVLLAELRN
jgi:predicted ATPase